MKSMLLLLLLTTLVGVVADTARAQLQRPGVGPSSPNAQNQSLETAERIRLMDERRRTEELRQRADPVANFMEAIKTRKRQYPDFDQVVFRSKTPVTADMLGLMAESPYAADIAYYLAKHPNESTAITRMPRAEAGDAVRKLDATIRAQPDAPK